MTILFLLSPSLIITLPSTFTTLTSNENTTVSLSYLKLLLLLISHMLKYKYLRLAYESFCILAFTYFFGLIYLLTSSDSYSFTFILGFSHPKILLVPQMARSHFFCSHAFSHAAPFAEKTHVSVLWEALFILLVFT